MTNPTKKLVKVDTFLYKTKAKMTLIALLDGPQHSAELARRVDMTQQAMSRLLQKAWYLDLVTFRRERGRRINMLTEYGRGIAEKLKQALNESISKADVSSKILLVLYTFNSCAGKLRLKHASYRLRSLLPLASIGSSLSRSVRTRW